MIRFIFPHPLLSVALTLIWLALVNKVTPGNVLLGAILGVVVPILTAPYWPRRAKVGTPLKVIEYVLIVLWDIIVANVEVALIILFKRNRDMHSRWITVPLELT